MSAAKYYPRSRRGSCLCIRAARHYTTDWMSYAERANEETPIFPLIERVEGFRNYREIMFVEGIETSLWACFTCAWSWGSVVT